VRHKKNTSREGILDAAIKLYLSGGLKALSMRRIARELRLTPMALYRHFRNKDAVLIALVDRGFTLFGEYQLRALAGKTASERLLLAGQAFLDFTLENPQFFKVIFMAPDIFAEVELPTEIDARARQTYQFLIDRVNEGMREGFLKSGDAEGMAKSIWAMSHGLASLYLGQMLETNEDGFRSIFMNAFMHLGTGIFVDGPTA